MESFKWTTYVQAPNCGVQGTTGWDNEEAIWRSWNCVCLAVWESRPRRTQSVPGKSHLAKWPSSLLLSINILSESLLLTSYTSEEQTTCDSGLFFATQNPQASSRDWQQLRAYSTPTRWHLPNTAFAREDIWKIFRNTNGPPFHIQGIFWVCYQTPVHL